MTSRIISRAKRKIFRHVNKLDAAKFQMNFLNDQEFENHFFLDCGANNGCSVRKFRNEIDTEKKYQIYSFEPNPAFANNFDDFENHKLISKAVWVEDGKLSFFDSLQNDKYGGTVCEGKVTGNVDYTNPLEVDSLDFSSWILNNFSNQDFIILKLDIEGAEYQVLDKMIEDGSLDHVNLLFIEWHAEKIDVDMKSHRNLIKLLRKANITPYDWHAAEYI